MPDDESLNENLAAAEEIADTLTVSASTFSRVLRRGMQDAIVEGARLESVLRSAALSISASALSAGLRPLSGLVGGGINAALGGLTKAVAGGLASAGTKAIPFAQGGVIGTPTAFPMAGGRVGLMGEAGREAVLPLARGTDGRLGVALEGADRSSPSVTININTPDAQSFRRSEAQVTAMLARAVGRGRRGL
ncbi:MAG: phage tail tape measure protein [Pseudomonadota bacterium]